jgi:hypothetical protein
VALVGVDAKTINVKFEIFLRIQTLEKTIRKKIKNEMCATLKIIFGLSSH